MAKSFPRIFAKPLAVAVLLCAMVGSVAVACAQNRKNSPQPYASIATNGVSYAGPGREAAYDLSGPVIHIGLLAPLHGPQKAEGEAMVAAAQMALHDMAQKTLPGGRRVALVVGDESGPSWGHISDVLLHLVFVEQSVAVVTSTSGDAAHISEQVGNRIGVPILTLSSDATTTQVDVPWIFRMGPSDALAAQTIAQEMYRNRGFKQVLLITERDHDGRVGGAALQQAARGLGAPAPDALVLDSLQPDFGPLLARVQAQSPQAIVLWTQPETAGRLMQAIWKTEVRAPIYLSPKAAQASSGLDFPAPDALGKKGSGSAGVWTVVSGEKIAGVRNGFARRYRQATGASPSPAAAETYDAMCLIVRALRTAGANRARVRDQIARVKDFPGASGTISFDDEGNNPTSIHLVRLEKRTSPVAIFEAVK